MADDARAPAAPPANPPTAAELLELFDALPPAQRALMAFALRPPTEIEIDEARLIAVLEAVPIFQRANVAIAIVALAELLARGVAYYADNPEELGTTRATIQDTLDRRIPRIYAQKQPHRVH